MPSWARNRKRLLLQRRGDQVTDSEGNTPDNWIDVFDVWAEITQPSVLAQAASGREQEIGAQPEQRKPHLLKMRGNLKPFIDHNCRLLLGARTVPPARVLEVLTADVVAEAGWELRVQCMEIVGVTAS